MRRLRRKAAPDKTNPAIQIFPENRRNLVLVRYAETTVISHALFWDDDFVQSKPGMAWSFRSGSQHPTAVSPEEQYFQ
jgi:hypothetical protein